MDQHRDEELLSHFWALHAAIIRRDGIEERMRGDQPLDRHLVDRSLAASEAVLKARADLYRHLMGSGWTPPDSIVKDLVFDETVLAHTDGALLG